jgi:tetratricopeptide (TPR) repeat protein
LGHESIPYTVFHGLWNFAFALMRLGFWVFPFLGLLGLLGLKSKNPVVLLLAALLLLFQAGVSAFFGLGSAGFGSRFYYVHYLILVILASGGLVHGASFLSRRKLVNGRAFAFVLLLFSSIYMALGVYRAQVPLISSHYSLSRRQEQRLVPPAPSASKSIVFIRTSPGVAMAHTANNWRYREEKCLKALFLDPAENRRLVDALADREPFVADWDFAGKRFVVRPYPPGEPDSWDYYSAGLNYGALLHPMFREKSEKALQMAARMAPGDPSALYGMGLHYFRDGNFEKAAEIFRELIEKAPRREDAYHYLAGSLQQAGKSGESEKYRAMLRKRFPSSPYCGDQ